MKSLNSLKNSLNTLSISKAARIKGGTASTSSPDPIIVTPTTPDPTTADSVGGPWDNRGKRPGTKG